jgi:hypothetical protein
MTTYGAATGGVSNISEELVKTSRGVRDVIWRLEEATGGIADDREAKEELEFWLRRLYVQVTTALDLIGLGASRADLVSAWKAFEQEGLQMTLKYHPEPGVIVCGAFEYLDAVIDVIGAIGPKADPTPATGDTVDNGELLRLERYLDRTAFIIEKRLLIPKKENDIQCVMDEYLDFIYGADCYHHFDIPGVVKNFRPDSGIKSLKVVIEFKFADSLEELKKCAAGLFEDAAGYRASSDWTRFYSVIYMTGAYGTKEHLLTAFEQAKMVNWIPVLVTGKGERTKSSKSAESKS